MIHKDYFMRMIEEIVTMVRMGLRLPEDDRDGWLDDLEKAVGDAVQADPDLFFSLDPESVVEMLDTAEIDENLGSYVVHAIVLEATMLEAEGQMATADLRRRQARAIAEHLGCSAPASDATTESLEAFFMEDPGERLGKGSRGRASGGGANAGFVPDGSLTQSEIDRFKF